MIYFRHIIHTLFTYIFKIYYIIKMWNVCFAFKILRYKKTTDTTSFKLLLKQINYLLYTVSIRQDKTSGTEKNIFF